MRRDDHLATLLQSQGEQELGDQLEPAWMDAVLRLFEREERPAGGGVQSVER